MSGRPFGKYTLLEKIGEGGMAEIWKASLRGVDGFEKILVVKKILPEFARSRQFITMFIQEAKVTSGLHHANVVQI
ncbi:MAG: protein kinase, partial [Myxococcota bacterium]|nr:protein kinase [Myxococcota bacterium]